MVFHKDAPENEKLVLKRSVLGLGRVIYLDVARMLEKIKSCLRYGGARFLYERERERERQAGRQALSQSEREREGTGGEDS